MGRRRQVDEGNGDDDGVEPMKVTSCVREGEGEEGEGEGEGWGRGRAGQLGIEARVLE